MTYLIVVLYLLTLSYLYDFRGYKKNIKINYYFSLLVLILISGLRYRMAPDSVVYMADYIYRTESIFKLSFHDLISSRYQPFWLILNSICKTISKDFVLMQIVSAFILNYCVFYFFRKTSSRFFTCILFYFISVYLYFNMEVMRESLAIAMFIISVLMYDRKKFYKCALFFLFAFLFHTYAILLGFLFVFINKNIPQWIKNTISIIMLLALVLIPNPLLLISSFLGESMGSTVTDYSETKLDNISILGYMYMFLRVYVVFYAIKRFKKLDKIPLINLNKNIIINVCIIYIVLVIIRIVSIPFLERVLNYFSLFIILTLTALFYVYLKERVIKQIRPNAYLGIIILITFYNIYPMLKFIPEWKAPFYRRYLPYDSVFEKERNAEREYINYIESKEY